MVFVAFLPPKSRAVCCITFSSSWSSEFLSWVNLGVGGTRIRLFVVWFYCFKTRRGSSGWGRHLRRRDVVIELLCPLSRVRESEEGGERGRGVDRQKSRREMSVSFLDRGGGDSNCLFEEEASLFVADFTLLEGG